MTLYDLANAMTIQGNVEVKVFEGDEQSFSFPYPDCDDFAHSGFDCECIDIDEMEVSYIYSRKNIVGDVWTVIEVTEEV